MHKSVVKNDRFVFSCIKEALLSWTNVTLSILFRSLRRAERAWSQRDVMCIYVTVYELCPWLGGLYFGKGVMRAIDFANLVLIMLLFKLYLFNCAKNESCEVFQERTEIRCYFLCVCQTMAEISWENCQSHACCGVLLKKLQWDEAIIFSKLSWIVKIFVEILPPPLIWRSVCSRGSAQ